MTGWRTRGIVNASADDEPLELTNSLCIENPQNSGTPLNPTTFHGVADLQPVHLEQTSSDHESAANGELEGQPFRPATPLEDLNGSTTTSSPLSEALSSPELLLQSSHT